jgi:hypothetical protein
MLLAQVSGAHLTTLFETPEIPPKPKHTMLPVLVVLFLLSYGLMTLLIVEQGTTIQAQRSLIQQLLGDSTELSALKGKAKQAEQVAEAQAQAHAQAEAQNDPQVKAPSTQAAPPEKTQRAHKGKVQRPEPERPPMPASDVADVRRSLKSI